MPADRKPGASLSTPAALEERGKRYIEDELAWIQARAQRAGVPAAELRSFAKLLRCMLARNAETATHLVRMAKLVEPLGRALGWRQKRIDTVSCASALHDLGKVAIADAILEKPGPLTERERSKVHLHTTIGADLLTLASGKLLGLAAEIALAHHECWNGQGYPHGLAGRQISRNAHAVMLLDRYDALRDARPYKPAMTHEEAISILADGDERSAPDHFEPALLDTFLEHHDEIASLWDDVTLASFGRSETQAD